MLGKWCRDGENVLYFIFRILVGYLFFQHGATKVFGWFTDKGAATGATWAFGFFEVLVGITILLGLLTRLAATGGALMMLIAYFKAHAPQALSPLANRGELALVYFAAFLVLMAFGAKKWNLDRLLFKKELI